PPDWLIALLTTPGPNHANGQHVNGEGRDGAIPVARLSDYVSAALANELAAVAAAPEGKRNDQLNRSAFSLGQLVGAGMIEREVVERSLIGAAAGAGLDCGEVERTVKSGIEAGILKPRELPEQWRPGNGFNIKTSAAAPRLPEPNWPELEKDAFHGLAGELVRILDPHTEADQAAILVQFLVAFGNAVGRGPHFRAEADRHGTNLFAVFVG